MDSYLTEEALWASGLASRLKLLQANFADDAPAARQTYITEEIDRALKNVVPARRKLYLEALAERFPAWQSGQTVPIAPTPLSAAPEAPSELLARFIQVVADLPPETQAEFVRKLREAGIVPESGPAATIELAPEAQKKVGLPPGTPLHIERAVKLLVVESEAMLALDQLAWTLWKQLASRSTIRKDAELIKLSGQYLAGDAEVSTQQLIQALEKTRRLIAGLMGAVGRAGNTYAKKTIARLSPEAIEDLARLELTGGGMVVKLTQSVESTAWRIFQRLAKEHLSEPAIENGIQEAMVKVAEDLMTGRAGR
jgi:hypothetical protein